LHIRPKRRFNPTVVRFKLFLCRFESNYVGMFQSHRGSIHTRLKYTEKRAKCSRSWPKLSSTLNLATASTRSTTRLKMTSK
ncbi:MAG: hypothetical protein Q9P90_04740, partial [candidate division KSB1 bacterium]|nr:hypothetical protein [candidate division KSB1 bacterium]